MKKVTENRVRGEVRPWEKLLLQGTVKGAMATMQETKRCGKGSKPSPALVDICSRVMKLPVEEPLKYQFPDEKVANNFRAAMSQHVVRTGQDKDIHVSRCECTVYIYRKDTTPTAS